MPTIGKILLCVWFIGALGYGVNLVGNLLEDEGCEQFEPRSWILITLSALLWPIVLPLAQYEISTRE